MMLYSNACQLLSNLKEKGRLPLLIVAGTPPWSFLYPALTYTFSEVRTNGLFLHGTVVKHASGPIINPCPLDPPRKFSSCFILGHGVAVLFLQVSEVSQSIE